MTINDLYNDLMTIHNYHIVIRAEMHCRISVLVTFELPLHLIVYLGINQTI